MSEHGSMVREVVRHDGSGAAWEADTTVIPVLNSDATLRHYPAPAGNSPWDTQIGGGHYQKYAIQPTEYIIKNNLNFCEGNVIKYVTRYKDKNGLEDLKKARHYLDILISELEAFEKDERYMEKNGY